VGGSSRHRVNMRKSPETRERILEERRDFQRIWLKSEKVEFVGTGRLSENFVVIKEWSGGGSCCYLITAFQTLPTFKILLEHRRARNSVSLGFDGSVAAGLSNPKFLMY